MSLQENMMSRTALHIHVPLLPQNVLNCVLVDGLNTRHRNTTALLQKASETAALFICRP